MKRLYTGLLIIIAFFTFPYSAIDAQEPATNYWPFKVGNTWTMDTKVGDKTVIQVFTVTKITHDGNTSDVTWECKIGDQVTQIEVYRFDDKGLYRVASGASGSNKITPPFPVMQYPMDAGKKWTWKGSIAMSGAETFQESSEISTSEPETLQLPAGVFKTIRVHLELTIMSADGSNTLIHNDYWFAPDVGMVQQKAKIGDTEILGVLTSYKLKD